MFLFIKCYLLKMRVVIFLSVLAVICFKCKAGPTPCIKGFKPCVTDIRCCCTRYSARCENQGKRLTYIPSLPDSITELTFRSNFLPSIESDTFKNISKLNLKTLSISYCKVINVSADAFATLKVLGDLGLDYNEQINQAQLSLALGSIQKTANITLSLKSIGLTELKSDLFHYLTDAIVTKLILDDNKLTLFDFKAVFDLRSLGTLLVKYNSIRAIIIGNGHESLTRVVFIGNELARFVPEFCSHEHERNIFPKLERLNLSGNFISKLNKQAWKCLKSLLTLELRNNVFRSITPNSFSELTRLTELKFSKMTGMIKNIEPYSFNNSHLKYLTLEGNCIDFKPPISENIFLGCGDLEKLVISRNNLKDLSDIELGKMFLPLNNLKSLTAVNCKIKTLPVSLCSSLTNLRNLVLDQNRIESLGDILPYADNLSFLSLQNNKILTLQKHNFPMTMHSNVINLNLFYNRFECTCDLLWFTSTVTNDGMIGNVKLFNWPNGYDCVTPASMAKTQLVDYKPTQVSCKNILLISVFCVSSFAVLFTVTASLTYRLRWYIQLWWYKLKINNREPERQPLLDAQNGQFRGYVIYDSNDALFVHHDFRVLVENELLYKLMIWERDASMGGSNLEQMVDSIYASETAIAVVSKSSLENNWVRFQINVALDRQVELRRDFLILVLLEDLVYKNMPNYWCVVLTRTPTVRWCADVNDVKRKVFEQQLKKYFNNRQHRGIQ